jgi:hypothetical protein
LPDLDSVDHPAADLLHLWRDKGVPALTSSPPWCGDRKDTLIERGCHQSATEHADFLREEMAEFIENRFWNVLPYRMVRDLPHLQLSTAAVKEERERKPRILCDHSWYPVNHNTLMHAPPEAMQFGRRRLGQLGTRTDRSPAFKPSFPAPCRLNRRLLGRLFIQLGQDSPSRLRSLLRHLLHSIDRVLSAPISDEKRNEAVSLKKLLTGDGSLSTRKLCWAGSWTLSDRRWSCCPTATLN